MIHASLSKEHSYTHSCSGTAPFTHSEVRSGNVPYKGEIKLNRTYNFDISKEYKSDCSYDGYAKYQGSVQIKSCYNDCSFCGYNLHTKYYDG